MAIYFTSDNHFYHTNVIKYCGRPYVTVEEMNEKLVLNWNTIVLPDDTVYVLGDFSMAFRSVELFSNRLNGKKFLVPGNHDFCHSYHKKSRNPENRAKWIKKYEENGWTVLPEQTTLEIPSVGLVNVCHMPYQYEASVEEKGDTDKYERFRLKNDGKWLLCGHVHEKWKTKNKQINVGVDVWGYKPVSIDQIAALIKEIG